MPANLLPELHRLRHRLVLTMELIGELDAERATALAAAPDEAAVQKVAALQHVGGIGESFVAVLVREVLYRPFSNRKQLASYVGLTPTPYQSGTMDRDRRIGAPETRKRARPWSSSIACGCATSRKARWLHGSGPCSACCKVGRGELLSLLWQESC
jgi:transposase